MAAITDTHDRARNGTLAVSGGRVVVEHADNGGRDPELDWEDGIVVLVDGLPPASRPCQILYGQTVEAHAPDEEPRIELFTEISHDQMAATLSVERHPGGRFRLEDQPPNRDLVLRRLLVERIPCQPPPLAVVDAALHERGIVHGVREDAVRRCLSGAGLNEQIAWGTRPVEPEDGELVLAPQLGTVKAGGLWSVAAGTVLATVRQARPGVTGITVCGAEVAVRDAQPLAYTLGDHVAASADGARLLATSDGFPRIEDGRLEVPAVARIGRDLDDRSGDIQGFGSIELDGSVREGRTVRVRGDLTATGSVEHARVEVGGSATVRGVITASHVEVGGMRAPSTRLLELLAGVSASLVRAHGMAGQLVQAAQAKGQALTPVQAAAIVVQRYVADSARSLKQAASFAAAQSDVLGAETAAVLRECVTLLLAIEGGSAPAGALRDAAHEVEARVGALQAALEAPVRLVAAALQASRIELGGDLEITGSGVIGCELDVLGDVILEGCGASLRGGRLTFGGTARIAELGSAGETRTLVVLGPHARLEAGVVYPGVTVEAAGKQHVFRTVRRDVALDGSLVAADEAVAAADAAA